jgi:hypothetical protein
MLFPAQHSADAGASANATTVGPEMDESNADDSYSLSWDVDDSSESSSVASN